MDAALSDAPHAASLPIIAQNKGGPGSPDYSAANRMDFQGIDPKLSVVPTAETLDSLDSQQK